MRISVERYSAVTVVKTEVGTKKPSWSEKVRFINQT